MKLMFFSFFFCASVLSAECRLTGIWGRNARIKTSFRVDSLKACRDLAQRRNDDQFFGLVQDQEDLKEMKLQFLDDENRISEVLLNGGENNKL
jgi:hypothetical protein